jgi:hypothetical protein
VGPAVAALLLLLGTAACSGRGLSVGGLRIEPGAETVYFVAAGDPARACRDAAARAQAASARVARCSLVGSTFACEDDDVPCRAPGAAGAVGGGPPD